MPATLSSFDGTEFKIALQGIAGLIQVTPRWVDRNEKTYLGSIQTSITGRASLQEVDRKWKPVTLEFKQSNLPGALANQIILDAFLTAQQAGGIHSLVIEGGTAKNVIFDWRAGKPVEYTEVTPTGEQDTTVISPNTVAQGRLYEVVLHLMELLA